MPCIVFVLRDEFETVFGELSSVIVLGLRGLHISVLIGIVGLCSGDIEVAWPQTVLSEVVIQECPLCVKRTQTSKTLSFGQKQEGQLTRRD